MGRGYTPPSSPPFHWIEVSKLTDPIRPKPPVAAAPETSLLERLGVVAFEADAEGVVADPSTALRRLLNVDRV